MGFVAAGVADLVDMLQGFQGGAQEDTCGNRSDPSAAIGCENIGNQATIPCGSTIDLYANPTTINFIVTITAFNSSFTPVNSGDWVKKLQKQKNDVHYLDIDLDFGGGKYFASLRLSRGHRGILEVAIFTSYTLKNDTDFPLLCFPPNQKPLSSPENKDSMDEGDQNLGKEMDILVELERLLIHANIPLLLAVPAGRHRLYPPYTRMDDLEPCFL
ncbi:hypothetical protein LOK49_LG14G01474, partial [Camellia lanceoleosa]